MKENKKRKLFVRETWKSSRDFLFLITCYVFFSSVWTANYEKNMLIAYYNGWYCIIIALTSIHLVWRIRSVHRNSNMWSIHVKLTKQKEKSCLLTRQIYLFSAFAILLPSYSGVFSARVQKNWQLIIANTAGAFMWQLMN